MSIVSLSIYVKPNSNPNDYDIGDIAKVYRVKTFKTLEGYKQSKFTPDKKYDAAAIEVEGGFKPPYGVKNPNVNVIYLTDIPEGMSVKQLKSMGGSIDTIINVATKRARLTKKYPSQFCLKDSSLLESLKANNGYATFNFNDLCTQTINKETNSPINIETDLK